jgi:hypothetical protein
MSRIAAFTGWLERRSDWLSPIVVKDVRQLVRGREFAYSFGGCLLGGLAVAFFGAADALTGTGTAGNWTFGALTGCLMFLGLVVVPIGAFGALRVERLEQTLDLVILTALSPRRLVVGRLLAQGVKLATFFAAMAPFIAMSFLLGGIDFVTILLSLAAVFLLSMWASAAGLFVSALFKWRTMMGLMVGAAVVVLLFVSGMGPLMMFFARSGVGSASMAFGFPSASSTLWWALGIATTLILASMANLVLLAENRLSLPTEDRTTPLRIGFFVQFVIILGWMLSFIGSAVNVKTNALEALGALAGVHLAIVAMFTVTEDLILPRRVLQQLASPSRWRWLRAAFGPGGGRGAAYVLAQAVLLVGAVSIMAPEPIHVRWFMGMCAYIVFFTGVPVLLFRLVQPERAASLQLRAAVLVLLPLALILPDVIHYLVAQPAALDLTFGARHLLNPLRTLENWAVVESQGWLSVPFGIGLAGVLACGRLIHMGMNITVEAVPAAVPPEQDVRSARIFN